jgi:hypothetical protein
MKWWLKDEDKARLDDEVRTLDRLLSQRVPSVQERGRVFDAAIARAVPKRIRSLRMALVGVGATTVAAFLLLLARTPALPIRADDFHAKGKGASVEAHSKFADIALSCGSDESPCAAGGAILVTFENRQAMAGYALCVALLSPPGVLTWFFPAPQANARVLEGPRALNLQIPVDESAGAHSLFLVQADHELSRSECKEVIEREETSDLDEDGPQLRKTRRHEVSVEVIDRTIDPSTNPRDP